MGRKRIGELLLERGVITRDQLSLGLAAQQRTRQRLGVTLIQLGSISEVQLAQVLAQSLGLATVDLRQVQVDWSAVHMLRARFCETHELFPFAIDKSTPKKRVMVALSDPLNDPALKEIEFTTGLEVAPYVSTYSQIRAAVLRYYHKGSPAQATSKPPEKPPAPPPPEDDAEVVVGQELSPDGLDELLDTQPISRKAVAKDLEFLFGGRGDDPTEKLEQKFWVLMQLLAKKNLVTREEFLKALEEGET
jgi:Type II secretion system (T2SS), protein E, N-terminal domain